MKKNNVFLKKYPKKFGGYIQKHVILQRFLGRRTNKIIEAGLKARQTNRFLINNKRWVHK